jgi:hypothetical protein
MSTLYKFDMTDEEVKQAREAAKLASRHLGGVKIAEGLAIGATLLVGRRAAMKVAGTNIPRGRTYAEAFYSWKRAFKFPEGKEAEAFYDHAIVCAENFPIAEGIIAGLSPRQKAEIGMFGLAKRVRTKLNAFEGKPKKARGARGAHVSREAEFEGRLLDVEERQMSEEPLKWWRDSPEDIGRAMAREDGGAFRRLALAGLALLDGTPLLENSKLN